MGITRRIRHNPDKENIHLLRESRPWDNQASLPSHPKFIPVRPPAPPNPAAERFTPLLRPPDFNQSASKNAPAASVSPSRKSKHMSSATPFAPLNPHDFQHPKPDIPQIHTPQRPPKGLSVSDRLRIFENLDQSVRERTPPHVLRKSPFKSALEAFGGKLPGEQLQTSSATSSSSSSASAEGPQVTQFELKTKIGNREVKPLFAPTKPPPLVGLPIPNKHHSQRADSPMVKVKQSVVESSATSLENDAVQERDLAYQDLTEIEKVHEQVQKVCEPALQSGPSSDLTTSEESSEKSSEQAVLNVPTLPSIPDLDQSISTSTEEQKMTFTDPDLMPRFSYRNSMRLPQSSSSSEGGNRAQNNVRSSFRHSMRIGSESVSNTSFLPRSSSFLHFDDDVKLVAPGSESRAGEESEPTSKAPSAWTEGSFDEPDSFDTFATMPKSLQPGEELKSFVASKEKSAYPRPGTEESEKPLSPKMSFHKGSLSRTTEDDEDGNLDVPNRFTRRPGAEGALRDLQRASVTAGNEIAASLRLMSERKKAEEGPSAKKEKVSRVQGDLFLRSRIWRRWNLRYASIVQQGYFGAVLLLFRSDVRGGPAGSFALKSSKMIALTDSSIRKVDGGRRAGSMYMFELKTSQRTYMFACNDEQGRDFWMQNLLMGSRERPRP